MGAADAARHTTTDKGQMGGQLFYLGVTHKTAPFAVRERVHPDADQLAAATVLLRDLADEHAVLCTCGRFEIYALTDCVNVDRWIRGLAATMRLPLGPLRSYMNAERGDRCAEHLLRVAAGVESQILGEPHVLTQVRRAFLDAAENSSLGPNLSALFRTAIHTGRRVRRETAIGASPRSFPTRAIEVIENQLGALAARSVLVVGAGQIAADVLANLASHRPAHMAVVNRNSHRAQRLADRFGAGVIPFAHLPAALADADATIVCTASPTFVIDSGSFTSQRRTESIIVDLAMPRNVHPDVGALPGVHLTHLDALTAAPLVNRSILNHAQRIIREQLGRFQAWQRGHRVAPIIQQLLRRAEHGDPVVARRRKRKLHRPIMQLKNEIAA